MAKKDKKDKKDKKKPIRLTLDLERSVITIFSVEAALAERNRKLHFEHVLSRISENYEILKLKGYF